MNKSIKKLLVIVGAVIGGIVGLFLLLYAVMAIIGCAMYGEARDVREYVCDIAGISDGIAPQGLGYTKEEDVFIQTGYDGKNTTLLYVVEDGNARRVKLLDENGETLKGHAGGVTCVKDCVYIANGSELHMFSLSELLSADKETSVAVKRVFCVDNNAAFCFTDDNYLYVGEFYRAGNYETDTAHHYTTPDGDENKAIVSAYRLGADGLLAEEGVQAYPEYCISITDRVQGFAVDNGTIMLSRSYGLVNSFLEYHSACGQVQKESRRRRKIRAAVLSRRNNAF